jgi:GNAT superfamily N-acetyltransferase
LKGIVVRPLEDVGRLEHLAEEADREGHAFVSRMIAEWIDGANRFDGPGERGYVVTADGEVIGVGGLNIDPYIADPTVGRVRHLFTSAKHRRSGVATMLLDRIVKDARATFTLLRLRTRNPEAAAFYRARSFIEVPDDEFCTHARDLPVTGRT